MQICHVYIGTILVGHLGRGRTTYPCPGNILITLCTLICPNMGNPREIHEADIPIVGLSTLRSSPAAPLLCSVLQGG